MTLPDVGRFALPLVVAVLGFIIAYYLLNRDAGKSLIVTTYSLEDAISEIKRELAKLENTPGARLGLELGEVEIKLAVQDAATRSSEAGLALPVLDEGRLGASAKTIEHTGSTVTVVLVPPQGSPLFSALEVSQLAFAGLLISTRSALHNAMANEPKLEAKSIKIVIDFVLTATRSNTANVKAKVLSVGLANEQTAVKGHSLTLTYKNPKYETKSETRPVTPP
jgi:hypothetical protein